MTIRERFEALIDATKAEGHFTLDPADALALADELDRERNRERGYPENPISGADFVREMQAAIEPCRTDEELKEILADLGSGEAAEVKHSCGCPTTDPRGCQCERDE